MEVEQVWYVADHDALEFPHPSAFMRSVWYNNELEIDASRAPVLGEQFETWSRRSLRGGPQGHTGAHVCGEPEWYKTGVPVDPDRRPVLYGADGIPVCCAPGRGIAWGKPRRLPPGGIAWGGSGVEAHGTDSCFGAPVLAPDVVYTQPPAVMGPVGNGLWFDLGPCLSGSPVLTVTDLGGANAVSAVQFRTGASCADATLVGGAIAPPFAVDTSGWDGFHGWAVVIPTVLGAGTISPTFTIGQTS